jgi:hypothetical protein
MERGRDGRQDNGDAIPHRKQILPCRRLGFKRQGSRPARAERRPVGAGLFFVLDLAVNFLAPWLLYRASRPHVDETHAIMISAGAPMVWGLVQFARSRKVDTLSVLSLGGIALSFAVFALGGSPKVLLVRESFIIGVIGVVFLGSALVRRPLMIGLIRGIGKSMPAAQTGPLAQAREEIESYAEAPWFRRLMTKMTVAFGLFCIFEMAARITLAMVLPTERFLLIAPIVRYATAGIVMALAFFYVAPAFRRQAARADGPPGSVSAAK